VEREFSEWIQSPKQKALSWPCLSSLFDLRGFYGDKTLSAKAKATYTQRAKQHSGFFNLYGLVMQSTKNRRWDFLDSLSRMVKASSHALLTSRERGIAPIIGYRPACNALACGKATSSHTRA